MNQQNKIIYRIVVTGTYTSGKSQFIRSISELDIIYTEAFADDKHDFTSPAYEFGRLTLDKHLLYLFGTPGSMRFQVDRRVMNEDFLGFVLMVDSRQPLTFNATKSILAILIRQSGFPIVIAANNQDLDGALSAEEARIALRVPYYIPVIPCIASDAESAFHVLNTLIEAANDAHKFFPLA